MATSTDAAAAHDLEGVPARRRDELKLCCAICSGKIPAKLTVVVWLVEGQITIAHVDCVFPRVERSLS